MSLAAWLTLGTVWSVIGFLTVRFFAMVVRRPDVAGDEPHRGGRASPEGSRIGRGAGRSDRDDGRAGRDPGREDPR